MLRGLVHPLYLQHFFMLGRGWCRFNRSEEGRWKSLGLQAFAFSGQRKK